MQLELDDAQREAVECPDRAVMVVAGPGTGKTRVLTARVKWLIESEGVDPARIQAITYTNRAAAEMRSRLVGGFQDDEVSGDGFSQSSGTSEVPVATFHAWAYRLVRKYSGALGFPREPVIFDEDAQEQLFRRILGRMKIPEEAIPIRHLKQLLDRVKANVACPLTDVRYDPEDFEVIAEIFKTYQEELMVRCALDFADILLSALEILHLHPEIRSEITDGLDHLLIDEFQDINAAQYRLIDALEHPGLNLFAVGDEDQTIYAFRGSSGIFIDQFVADFNAKLIPLGSSYRCSDSILYAAGTLISKNSRFYQRAPRAPSGIKEKPPIGVFEVEDDEEEARIISKLIRSWVNAGCSYKDIAVLYRVHYLADECESFLINNGIPTLRLLPERQRKEIPGDPIPLLRLAAHDSEWDWERAIGLPRDRLGELDDLRVRLMAIKEDVPLHTLIGRPSRFKKLSALAQSQLRRLNRFVKHLRKKAEVEAPSMLINMVVEHLHDSQSPWLTDEDEWLASVGKSLDGFDRISPDAILEQWTGSKDGIRVFHAPTITALLAARLLEDACSKIIGLDAERIPLPFSRDEKINFPIDSRPACVIGLNFRAEELFPPDTLLPDALYLTADGITDNPPEEPQRDECFNLTLAAHRLLTSLVGYRPGGGEDEILVFFDLETTGIEIYRAEIVELAAIKVLLKDDEIRELGTFHSLVKPRRSIPDSATSVHGITDDDVQDAPSLVEILPRFLDFIEDLPLAGHNIDSFDLPLLRKYSGELLDQPVNNLTLDTLPLSRRLFPGEPHRLQVLAEKFGIDVGTAHRALDDVRTNIAVFGNLIEIDNAYRACAFSPDLPLVFALARNVDESTVVDHEIIRRAAMRYLSRSSGDFSNQPFIKSLMGTLSDQGLQSVKRIVEGLMKGQSEYISDELTLESRIQMLREEALRLEDERSDVTLTDYLAHIALLTNGDFDSDEDAVRMMTLHAAKGLEFDRVIILGLEQGHLPHRLALNKTVTEIEEERRLCYVGITRARQRAALMYCRRRSGRWRGRSMFLQELPRNSYKSYRTKDRMSGG